MLLGPALRLLRVGYHHYSSKFPEIMREIFEDSAGHRSKPQLTVPNATLSRRGWREYPNRSIGANWLRVMHLRATSLPLTGAAGQS